jgi:transcription elongation factor Elf1
MSEVTCPRCHTRQQLADPVGYTCTGCGTAWMFVTCDSCGQRFHMRPGTTAWTCPACGHEQGSAAMVDLEEGSGQRPPAVRPRHAAPAKVKRPPTRRKLALIAAIGVAAVLLVSFAISSLGAPQGSAAPTTTTTTTTTTPPPPTSAPPVEALCLHLRDLQTPREDAFTRLAATLEDDAAAIEEAGKQNLADAVERLRVAVLAYRDALAAQGDTSAAAAQVAAAVSQLPCGAAG